MAGSTALIASTSALSTREDAGVPGVEIDPAGRGRPDIDPGRLQRAGKPGRRLILADRALVDRINAVDPALTLATLPASAAVAAGMVATVKIIPFAVPAGVLDEGVAAALAGQALRVDPFRPLAGSAWPATAARGQGERARQDGARARRAAGALGKPDRARAHPA